jgi:RNA polymerase sigma factor (sigma-70 family)
VQFFTEADRAHASRAVHDPDVRLVREIYVALRRFASVVAPPGIDPDDLVQEALARRLRIGSLSDLDEPTAYMRRTILNLASNVVRTSRRRQRAMTRLGSGDDAYRAVYPSDLEVLAVLEPSVRAVLYLAGVEGWSYAEIGALLGCSEGAARSRAVRGRRTVRAWLESDDD